MEVSVVPVAVHDGQICTIYELEMKLYKPKHYPKYTDITIVDWEETLKVVFVRELEDAIENHIALLPKISGIQTFKSEDVDSKGLESEKKGCNNDDDDDDGVGEDTEGAEDLGSDAQKRKQQGTDEVDYEDGAEEDTDDGELSEEIESDEGGDVEVSMDGGDVIVKENGGDIEVNVPNRC